MSKFNEDDYWRTSRVEGFFFNDCDDEEEDPEDDFDIVPDSVFSNSLHDTTTLPIHSVISKRCLDSVLQDTKIHVRYGNPSVTETVTNLFLGVPCALDCYVVLDKKLELLEKACETCDGNVILKVVLFLRKTLNDFNFHYHLSKHKVAVTQYLNYLVNCNKYTDLHSIYMAIGSTNELVNTFYLPARSYTSIKKTKEELINFFNVLGSIISPYNKTILNQYQLFAEFLIKHNLNTDSPTECLLSLIQQNIDNKIPSQEITTFSNSLKIDIYQQQWLKINVLAASEMWEKLLHEFVKPNAFMKTIKCDVDVDDLVISLYSHGAPKHVLYQFLSGIGNAERALYLGKKYQCHKFVIDKLIENRDRDALVEYKRYIPAQSEDYFYLEKELLSDKRWKSKRRSVI